MTLRCSLLLVLVSLASACAAAGRPPRAPVEPRLPTAIRVRLADTGAVRTIALEDYVRGVVISEAAPDPRHREAGEGMLEVQAVIARTYAIAHLSRHGREGYDLCSTTHCQLYDPGRLKTSSWSAAAALAARRTAGIVLWYGASPARAVYHADCGGHTSAARDVWTGSTHPYLVARADDGPASEAHTAWRFEASQHALAAALNGDPRTRVGGQRLDITVAARDAAGRAVQVHLNGSRRLLIRGEELREVLGRAFGSPALRSTRFSVRRSGSLFVFEGRGHGHGVGLCQAGALARLRAGASPADVLVRYYPGTRLARSP